MASLAQNIKMPLLIAFIAIVLYIATLSGKEGKNLLDFNTLIKIPLLLAVALFCSYSAEEVKNTGHI
jgi:hypothetical protein